MSIDIKDLRIDTYRPAVGHKGFFMRITHTPTSEYVTGSGRVEYKLKQRLIAELEKKVQDNGY